MNAAIPIKHRRLKFLSQLNMGQSPSSDDVTRFDEADGLPFLQGNAEFGAISPNYRHTCNNPPKTAKPDDLLVSVRAPVGALNIADQMYGIGRGLCAVTWKNIEPRFGWWALHFHRAKLNEVATGSTYEAVSAEDLGNLFLSFPDVTSQRVIANYLDRETTRIDGLITEKKRMLTLLEEKRTSLISRVVTRGLDPDAPMVRSGQEWLGEIPARWRVERAKNLFAVRDERSDDGSEELLTVSHITGVTSRADKNVYMFEAEDKAGYKRCMVGDLAINTLWAWMGAMGISPLAGIVSPD